MLSQRVSEQFRLVDGTGITVENKSDGGARKFADMPGDNLGHHLIGDQFSLINVPACLLSQAGVAFPFPAQDITRGNVFKAAVTAEHGRHRSFADPRRAKKNVTVHRQKNSRYVIGFHLLQASLGKDLNHGIRKPHQQFDKNNPVLY